MSLKMENYYVIYVTKILPTQEMKTDIIARVMHELVARQTHTLLIMQKILTLKLIVNAFLATSNQAQVMTARFVVQIRIVQP